MKNKKEKKMSRKALFVGLLVFAVLIGIINAQDSFGGGESDFAGGDRVFTSYTNIQYTQPFFLQGSGYNPQEVWSDFNKETCDERHDFILMIPPGGCSPTVVRSDLLEEQDVPVFCKVSSVQMNPLLDVSRIRHITFKGEKPKGVKSFSYYPANAYLRSRTSLEGSPVIDNVGYLVIVLQRNPDEKSMPDFIKGNVTAVIQYDTEGSWGVGKHDFFLSEMEDEEWARNYKENSFWNGKGFVRVESINEDSASISVYRDFNTRISSVNLKKGETSNSIRLGGLYCSAGMQIKLDDISYPSEKVLLQVDDQEFWVQKGTGFLEGKCKVQDLKIGDKESSVKIYCSGLKAFDLKLSPASGEGEQIDTSLEGEVLNYYNKAINDFEDIVDFYAYEKEENIGTNEFIGARALYSASELSRELGLEAEQKKYLIQLKEKYPDSSFINQIDSNLELGEKYSYDKNSRAVVYINEESHLISLKDVKSPDYSKLNADISVNGVDYSFAKGEEKTIGELKIKLEGIKENSIEIKVDERPYAIKEGDVKKIKVNQNTEVEIKISKINIEKEARFRILPESKGLRSEADLGFGVGIEKRAIELSPERTKSMIEDLNHQIEQWNKVNENLGNVVEVMKGTCFVTSSILAVKNFFSSLSGEAIARNKVMTGKGGWNEICNEETKGADIQGCLLKYNSEIEKSVANYQKGIEDVNKKISDIYNDLECGINKPCDEEKVKAEYKTYFKNEVYNDLKVPVDGETGTKLLKDIGNVDDFDLDTMKKLSIYNSLEDSAAKQVLGNELGIEMKNIQVLTRNNKQINELKSAFSGSEIKSLGYLTGVKTINQEMDLINGEKENLGDSTHGFLLAIPSTDNFELAGKNIKVGLKQKGNNYDIVKAVDSSNNDVTEEVRGYYKGKTFANLEKTYFKNTLASDAKVVKYFPGGIPGFVPFEYKGGWYYVKQEPQTIGIGKPSTDSGIPISYTLGYLGDDGRESSDDVRIDYYRVGGSLKFPGLDDSSSKALATKAERILIEARNKYKSSGMPDSVTIDGKTLETGVADSGTRCSDFMSPLDCHLMFNVCDPVLCPSSRCNFGGEYNVPNVVQSGIIGSLLLCLPNAQEGIAIPICLTGVHAGIDSFISILTSGRDCLQESLENGRNIGICDEIKSIYLCEFFWKQAVPLMDVFIPKLFELSLGQGVRGGGEYLTVQYAWDNMRQSVDYFKNEYAVSAMRAFDMRSTAEIGDEVCEVFVSARYPSSTNFFENLVEPDSPVQYTGWFSENLLTSATIPSISHYKVYYHIYAGKDIGANYVVYLDEPKDPGLYHASRYVVDRGYIRKGSQVDEARDVEAVSGYQKLCIDINGQTECGFGQVSTSFALNYLSDMYVEEQVSQMVSSTKDCISGTPSLSSLAQANLQSGVEDVINPQIYNKGIIRVCSTHNPGLQTGKELEAGQVSNDRWKAVGHCDDSNVKCWIDTESIKDALGENKELLESSLNEVEKLDLEYLEELGLMSRDEADGILRNAGVNIGNLDAEDEQNVLDGLEEVYKRAIEDWQKAKALFLRGSIYMKKALSLSEGESNQAVEREVSSEISGSTDETSGSSDGVVDRVEEDLADSIAGSEDEIQEDVEETQGISDTSAGDYQYYVSKEAENLIKEKNIQEGAELQVNEQRIKFEEGDWKIFYNNAWESISSSDDLAFLTDLESLEQGIDELLIEFDEEDINVYGGGKDEDENGDEEQEEERKKWSLDSAIEILEKLKGEYSDNKDFIDELYEDDLLTEEEYIEINGEGFWNLQEDVNYVRKLLLAKKAKSQ